MIRAGISPDFTVVVAMDDPEQGWLCWETLVWGPRVCPVTFLSPGAEARERRSLERFKLARE